MIYNVFMYYIFYLVLSIKRKMFLDLELVYINTDNCTNKYLKTQWKEHFKCYLIEIDKVKIEKRKEDKQSMGQ